MSKTGMLLDGIFASEAIDSSGEIVSIPGMDVSTMEEGHGVANYEHLGEGGGFGKEVVGRIVYVHKIIKESDCENDRQRSYWKQIGGIPFLYGVVRLADGAGHEGAKALAALIRDHVANDETILVRFSIEGTTVEKDGNKIKQSLAKRVALTLKPCNRTCVSGVISDPNAPEGFGDVKKAEHQDPDYAPLGAATVVECNPCLEPATFERQRSWAKILVAAGMIRAMSKALDAGSGDAAPSALSGGAALQREALSKDLKTRTLAVLKDYDGPFAKDSFKAFAKAKLPEVSEDFLNHFAEIAEHYHLRKVFEDKALPFLQKTRALEAQLIDLRKTVRDAIEGVGVHPPVVHRVQLRMNGELHPAGRFMVAHGQLRHLEDYYGLLRQQLPEGPVDDDARARLHGLNWNPSFAVTRHEPAEPATPAVEVAVHEDPMPPREAVFDYQRPGMYRPHVVEFGPTGAALDGKALSEEELELMLSNVARGVATLRYRQATLAKAEGDMTIHEVLQHLRAAEDAGHVPRGSSQVFTNHLYVDPVSGAGNQAAWGEFQGHQKPGVYLSMDGNDLKSINDTHGHSAGTAAIAAMGGALRGASETVGPVGKVFRTGGDEFVAHFPTYEHAAQFVRHAQKNLDQVAPIGGTHKLSMSFGLGNDYKTADQALYHAKAGKIDPISGGRAYVPGQVPHLAHSLVPGTEGPLHHTPKLPTTALPSPTQPQPQAP